MKREVEKLDPASSDRAALPASLCELRRDEMPLLKMRKSAKGPMTAF